MAKNKSKKFSRAKHLEWLRKARERDLNTQRAWESRNRVR